MLSPRCIILAFGFLSLGPFAWAQLLQAVDWTMLTDPAAQQFEDPYRDLSPDQFQSLMALARLQLLQEGELTEAERADLNERISKHSQDLQDHGLDPDWILAQREVVAERRRHAALATNAALNDQLVELSGYLLAASNFEDGETVVYLLPDRGICMHLPPPAPNQLVKLSISRLPEPLGPCIAASVRGRLANRESRAEVPVLDDTVMLWSRWQLEVSEAITTGTFRLMTADPETRRARRAYE